MICPFCSEKMVYSEELYNLNKLDNHKYEKEYYCDNSRCIKYLEK